MTKLTLSKAHKEESELTPFTFNTWLKKPKTILVIFLGIYTVYYLFSIRSIHIVQLVDYWLFMDWARGLSLQNINSLVHPFYPLGYHVLLRFGLEWGVDIARYGQFWSYIGSILALVSVFTIAQKVIKQPVQAAATTLLLASHPMFLYQAMREGTDTLAAGLTLLSIALLFQINQSKRVSLLVTLAGFILGLAYLIRYTSLLFLPIHLVFLWWNYRESKINQKPILLLIALYLFAFFITSLPQTIPSLLVKQNPFYNEQARNIWFGMYGDFDWTENWHKMPQDISLSQIIREDPKAFVQHTISEFSRIFVYEDGHNLERLGLERNVTLWTPLPVFIFWIICTIILFLDKRIRPAQKGLLLASLFIPILATSMAWLFFRFLLVPLAIQALLIGTSISYLGNSFFPKHTTFVHLVTTTAILILFLPTTHWHKKPQIVEDMAVRNTLITPILQATGVQNPSMLLSNNRLYQINNNPSHARYGLLKPFDENEKIDLPTFLKTIAPDENAPFLLFDWSIHAIRNIDYDLYQVDMQSAKDLLLPLQIADDYALYCQMPCESIERKLLALDSDDAFQMLEYAAFTSSDYSTQGIYIFGHATNQDSQELVIRSTLYDAKGILIEQYTIPSSRWFNDMEVANFHLLKIPDFQNVEDYLLTIELIASNGELITSSTNPINFAIIE